MSTNAALFPFTERTLPFVRHVNSQQTKYCINEVISYSGLGIIGKDASTICNHPSVGIPVKEINTCSVDKWDTLIVDLCEIYQGFCGSDPTPFFRSILSAKKEIVFVGNIADVQMIEKDYFQIIRDFPSQVKTLSLPTFMRQPQGDSIRRFKPIEIPVILVGGILKQPDTIEIILSLKSLFQKSGYAASYLTSRNVCRLLGMHSYDHIFSEHAHFSEEEKALQLNGFARQIIQAERSALLVVEAPDAIVQYSNAIPNGFGFQSYIVNKALSPDLIVASIPFVFWNDMFVNALNSNVSQRYGCDIGAVHVSNIAIDTMAALQNYNLSYVYVELDKVDRKLSKNIIQSPIPASNVVLDGGCNLFQQIKKTLLM